MNIGILDFNPQYEYMVVYKDKGDNTTNTWTLGESSLQMNYKQMKKDRDVEIIGIYQRLSDRQLLDIMTR